MGVQGGNTALGYQMMLEGIILHSMTSAADKGNYYIASAYAHAYADLIGMDGDKVKMPDHPAVSLPKNRVDALGAWEKYYFEMLSVMFKEVHNLLAEIRKKYRQNKDIPEFESTLSTVSN